MTNKLLISASALVLGMALSGAALAEAESGALATGGSTANSSATQIGDDNSSYSSTVNASKTDTKNTSVDLSSSSTKVEDSNNVKNSSENTSKVDDSYNVTNKSDTDTKNTSLTFSKSNTDIEDSYNNKSGSHNTTSNTSYNITAALSLQALSNSVSHVGVYFGDGEGGAGGSGGAGGVGTINASSNLSTGAVTSSGANDFSGIQTANYNTGFGSAVQGATSLAATSSISFTDGNN